MDEKLLYGLDDLNVYEFQDIFKDQIDNYEITKEMEPYLFNFMNCLLEYNKVFMEQMLSRLYMDLLEFTYIPENQNEAFAEMIYEEVRPIEYDAIIGAFGLSDLYEDRYENDLKGLIKEKLDIDETFLKKVYQEQLEFFTSIHPDIKISNEYDSLLFDTEIMFCCYNISKYITKFINYPY